MWNVYRLHTMGDFTLRRVTFLLLAIIVPVFLWFFTAPTAHALDATWKGEDLSYGEHDYKKLPAVPAGTTIPAGSTVYEYREPGTPETAHILYFPSGTNLQDATSAQHTTYSVVGNNYSSPGAVATVGVNGRPAGERPENDIDSRDGNDPRPCAIKGVGWVVCPATNWLAAGMDAIFKLMKNFLEVKPLASDTTSPMYRAWEMMRNLANIAFVGAFLLVIYGQIVGGAD